MKSVIDPVLCLYIIAGARIVAGRGNRCPARLPKQAVIDATAESFPPQSLDSTTSLAATADHITFHPTLATSDMATHSTDLPYTTAPWSFHEVSQVSETLDLGDSPQTLAVSGVHPHETTAIASALSTPFFSIPTTTSASGIFYTSTAVPNNNTITDPTSTSNTSTSINTTISAPTMTSDQVTDAVTSTSISDSKFTTTSDSWTRTGPAGSASTDTSPASATSANSSSSATSASNSTTASNQSTGLDSITTSDLSTTTTAMETSVTSDVSLASLSASASALEHGREGTNDLEINIGGIAFAMDHGDDGGDRPGDSQSSSTIAVNASTTDTSTSSLSQTSGQQMSAAVTLTAVTAASSSAPSFTALPAITLTAVALDDIVAAPEASLGAPTLIDPPRKAYDENCGTTKDATLSDCHALLDDPAIWNSSFTLDNTCTFWNPYLSMPPVPRTAYNLGCHGDCCVYYANKPDLTPGEQTDYWRAKARLEAQTLLVCGNEYSNSVNGMGQFGENRICISNGEGCGDCFEDGDYGLDTGAASWGYNAFALKHF